MAAAKIFRRVTPNFLTVTKRPALKMLQFHNARYSLEQGTKTKKRCGSPKLMKLVEKKKICYPFNCLKIPQTWDGSTVEKSSVMATAAALMVSIMKTWMGTIKCQWYGSSFPPTVHDCLLVFTVLFSREKLSDDKFEVWLHGALAGHKLDDVFFFAVWCDATVILHYKLARDDHHSFLPISQFLGQLHITNIFSSGTYSPCQMSYLLVLPAGINLTW